MDLENGEWMDAWAILAWCMGKQQLVQDGEWEN